MIEKIILNIRHSDDYTDYLLLTTGLTNRRIIPLIDGTTAQLKAQSDCNTLILTCYNSRKELHDGDRITDVDANTGTVRIFSRAYLDDDGTIRPTVAEIARAQIQEMLTVIFTAVGNLRELYRYYFPLFWEKREVIYKDPRLFFTPGFCSNEWPGGRFPLGAILKAIEAYPKHFHVRLGGGCSCGVTPILVVYDYWTLHTWCPACHSFREIRAWNFQRAWTCEKCIETFADFYDKGQGSSPLTILDVVDALT